MGFLAPLALPLMGSIGTMFGAGATAAGVGSLATGASIASTALGVGSALYEGSAKAGMANYRAQVARNNASILLKDSDNQLLGGANEEAMQRLKVGRLVSSQKALQAASGVDVALGSAAQVRESTQDEGDFDALTIRYNAAKAAYGSRQQAAEQMQEAAMQKAAAKNAKFASYIGAASSLAGGIGRYADIKAGQKTSGVKK
jgi:hypothetical protein